MEDVGKDKFRRAKKRVGELKGFYIHFTIYLLVNVFILANIFVAVSNSSESFWQWGHFFTAIFWGIGVAFHAAKVFNFNPFFGKNWEEKQIQKYIEEDEKQSKKFR